MEIIVIHQRSWGKDLYYPSSEDAIFLTKLFGRPTFIKKQLDLCSTHGWVVKILQKPAKEVYD